MSDEAEPQANDDAEISISAMPHDGAQPTTSASVPADPFAPRRTHRAHLLRTSAAWAAVLIVTAALLFTSLRPTSSPTTSTFPTPGIQTSAVEPGRVYFMGWVPWGRLQIDNAAPITLTSQLVYPAPDGFLWPSFVLTAGRHTLHYTTDDFPALTCTLSAPEAQNDTCPISHLPNTTATNGRQPRRALILPATPERLSTDDATSLAAAVQHGLDAFAQDDAPHTYGTVAAGEPILTASGQIEPAPISLRAYPQYHLNTDLASAIAAIPLAPSGICVTLCAADPQLSLYPDEERWPITANVAVSWQYQNASTGQLLDRTPTSSTAHVRINLAVRRSVTGWQVQVLQQPLCQSALQQAHSLVPSPSKPAAPISWAALSYTPVVDGCLLPGYLPNARGGTAAPTALLVYRFGVLLTANPLAAQIYPQLPAASTDQAARAQAIISA